MNAAVVEVAIGLALIFLIFSLAVSGIYEAIAKLLAWRAKSLWAAIYVLVEKPEAGKQTEPGKRFINATPVGDVRPVVSVKPESTTAQLYAHPLVGALEQRTAGKRTRIDMVDPGNFARALIDVVMPDAGGRTEVAAWVSSVEASTAIPEQLKQQLLAATREADDTMDNVRAKIQDWFNGQMTRLSLRYRRRARIAVHFIGLALAVALNVDAISVTRTLYSDDVTRAALVAQAESLTESCATKTGDERTACISDAGDQVHQAVDLPVGWNGADVSAFSVLGWILSGLAFAQGAPFWFSILKRVVSLRQSSGHGDGS